MKIYYLLFAVYFASIINLRAEITLTPLVTCLCGGPSQQAFSLEANGAAGPFTFEWFGPNAYSSAEQNPVDISLPGSYDVFVTNNYGCTVVLSATVATCDQIIIEEQITPSCLESETGIINLTVSGGSPPYSYFWSNATTNQNLSEVPAGNYCVTITDAIGCIAEGCFELNNAPAPFIGSQITPACAGESNGAIEVIVIGGTPVFTFNWSNGAQGSQISALPIGNYTVTATDGNGCEFIESFTLNEFPPSTLESDDLVASVTHSTSSSPGNGAIDITVNGGTSPLNYTWLDAQGATVSTDEDITGLSPGEYCVIVTDLFCGVAVLCVTVELNCDAIEFIESSLCPSIYMPSTCNSTDGAITFTGNCGPTGGTPPYTYEWNTGETNPNISSLQEGIYALTVTDANGCTTEKTFELVSSELEIVGEADPTCESISIGNIYMFVFPSNLENLSVEWSNGEQDVYELNDLSAGTYCVTVTDNESLCSKAECFEVESIVPIPIELSAVVTHSCPGEDNGLIDLTISGGNGYFDVLWFTGDGAYYGSSQNLPPGNYYVEVSDYCEQVAVEHFTIIEYPEIKFTEYIEKSCPDVDDGLINLTITDGDGPFDIQWSNGVSSLNNTGLAAGDYSVTVTDIYGCSKIRDFTVGEHQIDVSASIEGACYDTEGLGAIGSISLSVSGGVPPYSYQWEHMGATFSTISKLSPGDYDVTIIDQECSFEFSFHVPSNEWDDVPSNQGTCWTDLLCGSVTVDTYWSGIQSHSVEDCYYKFLCGNGVTHSIVEGEVSYTYSAIPNNSNAGVDLEECKVEKICSLGEISIIYPNGYEYHLDPYEWVPAVDNEYAVTSIIEGLGLWPCEEDEYLREYYCGPTLIYSDCLPQALLASGTPQFYESNNADRKSVTSSEISGIDVYPNPFMDKINIEINTKYAAQDYSALLYNSIGQIVLAKDFSTLKGKNVFTINFNEILPSGVYILKLLSSLEKEENFVLIRKPD